MTLSVDVPTILRPRLSRLVTRATFIAILKSLCAPPLLPMPLACFLILRLLSGFPQGFSILLPDGAITHTAHIVC